MIITFRCKASANVTMFGHVATEMLKMMGHSATVPGAILAQDIAEALDLLCHAIESEKKKVQPEPDEDEEDKASPDQPVSLVNRAMPLIALLKAAQQEQCDVMWDEGF